MLFRSLMKSFGGYNPDPKMEDELFARVDTDFSYEEGVYIMPLPPNKTYINCFFRKPNASGPQQLS